MFVNNKNISPRLHLRMNYWTDFPCGPCSLTEVHGQKLFVTNLIHTTRRLCNLNGDAHAISLNIFPCFVFIFRLLLTKIYIDSYNDNCMFQ